MQPIRILIVDDSVLIRGALVRELSRDPELRVVGVAENGRIALDRVKNVSPDIILLDIGMPEMDGLEFLDVLRGQGHRIPVLVLSSLTQRGTLVTIEALSAGASDYVAKPSRVTDSPSTLEALIETLVAKIKLLAQARAEPPRSPTPSASEERGKRRRKSHELPPRRRVDIVAIGVSTGGPSALAEVIPVLPAELPVPVVVVQHMPPRFTAQLARSLGGRSAIRVVEGASGDEVVPGCVFIAPGDRHMVVHRTPADRIELVTHRGPRVNSCRPAVDVLFESVASVYGRNVLAVVLTGMGFDGLNGSRRVVDEGGEVIAQDEASSVVWSMPRAVSEAGLAREVVPLSAVADMILRRVAFARPSRAGIAGTDPPEVA